MDDQPNPTEPKPNLWGALGCFLMLLPPLACLAALLIAVWGA